MDLGNVSPHIPGAVLPSRLEGPRPDRELGIVGWWRYTFGMRSGKGTMSRYNQVAPLPVLQGISDAEKEELLSAQSTSARIGVVMFWVTDLITSQYQVGAFGGVSPPVVSRLYQELSDGMLGFQQARKIAYVPFPFIYAQGTEVLMSCCVFLIPLLMKGFVDTTILGGIMTYLSCTCFFVLYEACRELEDPFLYEPNELPLRKWQSEFNELLLSVTSSVRARDAAKANNNYAHPSHVPFVPKSLPATGRRSRQGSLTDAELAVLTQAAKDAVNSQNTLHEQEKDRVMVKDISFAGQGEGDPLKGAHAAHKSGTSGSSSAGNHGHVNRPAGKHGTGAGTNHGSSRGGETGGSEGNETISSLHLHNQF